MKKKLFYVFAVLVLISIGVYYQNSEEILATSPLSINPVGICMAANTILCENGCSGSIGLTPLTDDPIQSFPSKCFLYRDLDVCIDCCLEELCADLDAPEMGTPIQGLEMINPLFFIDFKKRGAEDTPCFVPPTFCPSSKSFIEGCTDASMDGIKGSSTDLGWAKKLITKSALKQVERLVNDPDEREVWKDKINSLDFGEAAAGFGFGFFAQAVYEGCTERSLFGDISDAVSYLDNSRKWESENWKFKLDYKNQNGGEVWIYGELKDLW